MSESRKADHLALCATAAVGFRDTTTLLEEVGLVHEALPELSLDQVDLSTSLLRHPLGAPLVLSAMTGGVDEAEPLNRALARVAQEFGLALGFGSMRPLLERGDRRGYLVRDQAPDAMLLGNLGVVQARKIGLGQLQDALGETGCDALCVHLNPAMEVVQPEGDRDFRGGIEAIARMVSGLDVPVIVKETGSGLSRATAERLVRVGVRAVDVSGAGGTSWVGVEALRADATRALGERFWDWGIPTAASLAQLTDLELEVIATGGVSHGIDVARALALGATAGGMARAVLQAWTAGGEAAVRALVVQTLREIRVAMLLTGAGSVAAMRRTTVVIGPNLMRWVPPGVSLRQRLAAGPR
ncbi:MAG: type 2 isopentenyl-diphosphate Delta-isomerase [Deltaproteobacteria bacterium]|nr:type 2 isopentenyl-diphosphate Delta-isomerase [Deltaproteobacteria bacterium]